MKQLTFSLLAAMLLGVFSTQAQTYCTYSSTTADHYISSFSTQNATTNISNLGTLKSATGYDDYSAMSVETFAGGTFDINVVFASGPNGTFDYNYGVWVDWDNDGIFVANEKVISPQSGYYPNGTGTVNVPVGTVDGSYRMRVMIDYLEFFSNDLNPCEVGGSGEAEDYTVLVNNTVSCMPPSAFASSNLTTTSVDLAWTAGATETEWEVIHGVAGFDPNNGGTTVTVNTTPSYALTSLVASTEYDFYVQAVCGTNDLSAKIGPVSVKTLCTSATVPYVMDFESITPPAIDFCTSIENVGSGNDWETVFNGINGFSSNVLRYGFSNSASADVWFYTQGI